MRKEFKNKYCLYIQFQVYCNFKTGATEVMHDTEVLTDVLHCHDPGVTLATNSSKTFCQVATRRTSPTSMG